MSVLHIFLFLSLLCHHGLLASATSNRVSTQQGHVVGTIDVVQYHNGPPHTVYKFLGIPYAKSPTGDLRFKPPQPPKQRPKNYNASYYRPICLQIVSQYMLQSIKLAWPRFDHSTDMDEDCLYLNIYTPSTNCTRKYPVVVYIHGGSYVTGTPIRDVSPGEYLPRHDVVLVTIQYRLEALGFFTTGDSEAPGNLGLLDQIEALKWIQNNIDCFCGDKNRVTIVGDGSGGSSVSMQYLSSQSQGLFHRGIAVSGVALSFFSFKPKSTVLKASKIIITALHCERNNSKSIVKCLRSKTGRAIYFANKDYLDVQPFVDNDFLPDEPEKLLKEGTFQRLPLMSGFVSNEGENNFVDPGMRSISDYKNYLDSKFFQKELNFTKQQAPIAFNALTFQYTPWHDMERSEAYRDKVMDMLGDYYINAPTHDVLSFHSNRSASTYMFEFAHRSRHHTGVDWRGVVHGDTTAYMFGLPLLRFPKTNLVFDDDDRSVSKKMVTLFTNFAKSGNPNTPSPVSGDQWTTFNKSNKVYLKVQTNPVMTSNYHPQRMAFWNRYFPTLFPCWERNSKPWFGHCKRSEAARPSQLPNGKSNPATLVHGAPNPKTVLW